MAGTWWVEEDDLKKEQLKVLEVPFDKNVLVVGPPGSGKTNLLLLRANHLHLAEQSEFYVVAYTSLLANFIRTGAKLYSFPQNKIITQDKLFENVLGDHGIPVPHIQGEDFEQRKAKLRNRIEKLMSTGKAKGSYPVLFIDEAQDYSEFELSVFRYLGGAVCFSADARQGIYDTDANDVSWLAKTCDPVITLTFHFRVGKKILALADRMMEGKLGHIPMLPTSQYKEEENPSSVDVVKHIPLAAQVDQAANRLAFQLKAYPNEILGVLVPRREEFAKVWALLNAHPAVSGKVTNAVSQDFDPDLPIWVSTIHSAKGLEFRSVHLLAADTIERFKAHSRRVAFTAVTRAKTALIIYHDSDLPPFFAAALGVKSEAKITLKNLLGLKS